jgi:lysozyme
MRTALASCLILLIPNWFGEQNDLSRKIFLNLQGVDVSHHQKQIEWDMVAEKGALDFAFVKATEGHNWVDSLFCQNWESLRRVGLRRGAYHYFRSYGCGLDQAKHFLSTVEFCPGDLAPVLDIETTDGMPPELMLQEVRIWLQTVEQRLKVKPIIYTYHNFYERYFAGHLDQYPLWVARYSEDKPLIINGKNWNIWQYSNLGCIDGITRYVDMNVFPGTLQMLERLCWYPQENADFETAAP